MSKATRNHYQTLYFVGKRDDITLQTRVPTDLAIVTAVKSIIPSNCEAHTFNLYTYGRRVHKSCYSSVGTKQGKLKKMFDQLESRFKHYNRIICLDTEHLFSINQHDYALYELFFTMLQKLNTEHHVEVVPSVPFMKWLFSKVQYMNDVKDVVYILPYYILDRVTYENCMKSNSLSKHLLNNMEHLLLTSTATNHDCKIILKPSFSASCFGTYIFSTQSAMSTRQRLPMTVTRLINELFHTSHKPYIIFQTFDDNFSMNGEVRTFWIDGKLKYAIHTYSQKVSTIKDGLKAHEGQGSSKEINLTTQTKIRDMLITLGQCIWEFIATKFATEQQPMLRLDFACTGDNNENHPCWDDMNIKVVLPKHFSLNEIEMLEAGLFADRTTFPIIDTLAHVLATSSPQLNQIDQLTKELALL